MVCYNKVLERQVAVLTIELTAKEFRRLLDMVYIGNWILNSCPTDIVCDTLIPNLRPASCWSVEVVNGGAA